MSKETLAYEMLSAFSAGFFETDNEGRLLTQVELYALICA